jgi:hypothetical protein
MPKHSSFFSSPDRRRREVLLNLTSDGNYDDNHQQVEYFEEY